METFKYNGLVITKNPLYYGLVIFSISYNPKPIDEVHHFSRWLKPHHQPVEFMNHFVSAGLTFNLDTSRPIQETFSPWLWHMTRDMLRCSSTFCFFLSEFFFLSGRTSKWTCSTLGVKIGSIRRILWQHNKPIYFGYDTRNLCDPFPPQ